MSKLNGKNLIFYTLDQAIKCNFKKKIILTTSDQEIIQKVGKRYRSKVKIHKREKKLSFENVDMKQSVVQAISKFYERMPDILVILAFQNPLRDINSEQFGEMRSQVQEGLESFFNSMLILLELKVYKQMLNYAS